MKKYILPFQKITAADSDAVGEKNASIGELIQHLSPLGINVPDGFALTVDAYFEFLDFNSLFPQIQAELNRINRITFENDAEVCARCRELVMRSSFPEKTEQQIKNAYNELVIQHGLNPTVAVRSSGTINRQFNPGFNGLYDTYLNVNGSIELLQAIKQCYASLYSEKALHYRAHECCSDILAGISVGIQLMVRSDKGSAGVALSIDAPSANNDVIYIAGSWGLGQGEFHNRVNADEFYLSKKALRDGTPSLLLNVRGLKEEMLVFGVTQQTQWTPTPVDKQQRVILDSSDLELLGLWCMAIEKHYQHTVEVEWAKDGQDGKLYILQAREEKTTSHKTKVDQPTPSESSQRFQTFIRTGLASDIPLLHRESLDWLKQIEFMKDEILFMQKLVTNILHISLADASCKKISEELSYLMDHSILQLHHRIIEHESWLADIIRTDTPGRQVSYREIHSELKDDLMKYRRVFLQLRQSIFFISKEYYQNKIKAKSV